MTPLTPFAAWLTIRAQWRQIVCHVCGLTLAVAGRHLADGTIADVCKDCRNPLQSGGPGDVIVQGKHLGAVWGDDDNDYDPGGREWRPW